MFDKVRTSLRKPKGARRQSLRVQRGGAAWPAALDWSDLSGTVFDFLIRDGGINQAADPANNVARYITVVERQDELFRFAMDAIYRDLGTSRTAPEKDRIAAAGKPEAKTTSSKYLKDVMRIITFSDTLDAGSKFSKILDARTPAVELLVNPASVSNVFMGDLATVCITQKSAPSLLEEASSNEDVKKTRALNYESVNERNSRGMTNNRSRDGFFLGQSNFRSLVGYDQENIALGFWYKFLTRCIGENGSPGVAEFTIPPRKTVDTYAYLAAYVFNTYKGATSAADLKSAALSGLIKDAPAWADNRLLLPTQPRTGGEYTGVPNDAELDKEVVPAVTLRSLLQRLQITDIQFVVHLCYTITSMEEATLAQMREEDEAAAAAQPSSPETEAPPAPTAP